MPVPTPVEEYCVYTDGSLRRDKKDRTLTYGAWAAIITKDGEIVATLSAPVWNTTISRMELTAVREGLLHLPAGATTTLYSDSQYTIFSFMKWIHSWVRNGWKTLDGRDVANRDLMEALWALKKSLSVRAKWVKRNSTELNARCDEIAQELTRQMVAKELLPPD